MQHISQAVLPTCARLLQPPKAKSTVYCSTTALPQITGLARCLLVQDDTAMSSCTLAGLLIRRLTQWGWHIGIGLTAVAPSFRVDAELAARDGATWVNCQVFPTRIWTSPRSMVSLGTEAGTPPIKACQAQSSSSTTSDGDAWLVRPWRHPALAVHAR